jgi:hypothetical protein
MGFTFFSVLNTLKQTGSLSRPHATERMTGGFHEPSRVSSLLQCARPKLDGEQGVEMPSIHFATRAPGGVPRNERFSTVFDGIAEERWELFDECGLSKLSLN